MKKLLTLMLASIVVGGCARRMNPEHNNTAPVQASSPQVIAAPSPRASAEKSKKEKSAPLEFKGVDFKNFTYPIARNPDVPKEFRKRLVALRNGAFEFHDPKGLGGATYDLRDIDYIDLTGDGKPEAVVRLSQVFCGGSCDGGSDFFYFYVAGNRKPVLLSQIEFGSFAYNCGLKSFVLRNRRLELETFRSCRFGGVRFRPAYHGTETGGKFLTNRYTHLALQFAGNRFVIIKRKVFEYPLEDYRS